MEAVGDDLPYQRGITFALRTIFPDGFYDSMLTLRFTSTFEMRSKQREISRREPIGSRACLVPVGVEQRRCADGIEPGTFLQ